MCSEDKKESKCTFFISFKNSLFDKHIVQQTNENTNSPEILREEGIDNSIDLPQETREEDISIDCNPTPQSYPHVVSQPKEGICS